MSGKELNTSNFRRIWLINWLLAPPLLALFCWPYLYLAGILGLAPAAGWTGAVLFSFTFSLTILHGHVTMALGTLHRGYYYDWLNRSRRSYGLLFHPMVATTRFRLALFYASMLILLMGDLLTG